MRANMQQKMASERNVEENKGMPLWVYNRLLIFFCLVGLGLSLYAYVVELHMDENKNYKPYCDISPHMSCTKAFGSSYGKGFGIFGKKSVFYKPNSFFGIVFYSMIATLSLVNSPVAVNASLFLIILSNFASMYFAYILYFILKDMCLVCIGTYLVNVMNLILITKKHKKIRELSEAIQTQHEVSQRKKAE
ncbi:vitamin K epoxide reductase complex subunit 1-like protein 1 [Anthonomus grandis grandis]|uniref:vitamin K epoxide reductase complex subunit 1-like protein 1 n=1 Tax=Anthonomus grandis grandis TaxID=2921223 RepID=UPI0021661071|nr:vitamin K epoxide reductase complex subunit 1-like protein 1 [Anthonomus grandis grandis]